MHWPLEGPLRNERTGVLATWSPGSDTVGTQFANTVDFYFSFGIGITIASHSTGESKVIPFPPG